MSSIKRNSGKSTFKKIVDKDQGVFKTKWTEWRTPYLVFAMQSEGCSFLELSKAVKKGIQKIIGFPFYIRLNYSIKSITTNRWSTNRRQMDLLIDNLFTILLVQLQYATMRYHLPIRHIWKVFTLSSLALITPVDVLFLNIDCLSSPSTCSFHREIFHCWHCFWIFVF